MKFIPGQIYGSWYILKSTQTRHFYFGRSTWGWRNSQTIWCVFWDGSPISDEADISQGVAVAMVRICDWWCRFNGTHTGPCMTYFDHFGKTIEYESLCSRILSFFLFPNTRFSCHAERMPMWNLLLFFVAILEAASVIVSCDGRRPSSRKCRGTLP